MYPPTTGPTVGARTANTPGMVAQSGCNRAGKSKKTAEKTTGINTPPENPWTILKVIKDGKFSLAAQAIDASVNTKTAMVNSHLIVSARIRNPVSGIEMISAIKYAVWIQLI